MNTVSMAQTNTPRTAVSPAPQGGDRTWTSLALLAAVMGTGGSLYLSMGMGLQACPLCFYQRTFLMGVVGVLAVGLAGTRHVGPSLFSLLSLPMAIGGLGVALVHNNLEYTGKLECPKGVLGLGTAPQQSLALFVLVTGLLLVDVLRLQGKRPPMAASMIAIILGFVFTFGCVASSPKPPKPDYDLPLLTCRPPKPA